MKKLLLGLMSVCLLASLSTSATALVSVSALGGMMTLNPSPTESVSLFGVGARVELPIFMFCETNVEAILLNGEYSGSNFQAVPITLNLQFGIPLTPLYLGVGGGPTLLTWTDSGGGTAPTNLVNYHAHLGYESQFMPFCSYFVQAGYEVLTQQSDSSLSNGMNGGSVKVGATLGI